MIFNGGSQMQKIGMIVAIVSLSAVSAASPLLAQTPAQTPHPTCDHCQASYVPKSELDAYFEQAKLHDIIDQQVRSADLGSMQVGIGAIYRGKLDSPAPHSVAEHDQVSEVYYILDGAATL